MPNIHHYFMKIEAPAKKGFLIKKPFNVRNQVEIFLIFFLNFVSLFCLIVYSVGFNTKKNVLPFLISPNQMAYFKNRFISETGRFISNILKIVNTPALEGFLVTENVEKAFDSVNHYFLLQIL